MSEIPAGVREEIMRRLRRVEEEHHVRILFAIESGSRAWGFESTDSDYDVRFIFARRLEELLSIDEPRDVIETPIEDDIDLNGWELRKALRLFRNSNPGFAEWVQSPIIYIQTAFLDECRELLPRIYSCERGVHHYRSMALTNFDKNLVGDLVPLKKYFYVLRPLLAVRWILRYQQPAPLEFERLLSMIDDEPGLLRDIHELLVLKRSGVEMGRSARIPSIHGFIEREFEAIGSAVLPELADRADVTDQLDELMRRWTPGWVSGEPGRRA